MLIHVSATDDKMFPATVAKPIAQHGCGADSGSTSAGPLIVTNLHQQGRGNAPKEGDNAGDNVLEAQPPSVPGASLLMSCLLALSPSLSTLDPWHRQKVW